MSELIFCGFIDSTHIFFASFPICSGENFANVLPHACPIPDTGTVLCSDSAFMIPEIYVDSSLKSNPFEFINSNFSYTMFNEPVIVSVFPFSAELIIFCAISIAFEPEISFNFLSNVPSSCTDSFLSGSPIQNSLGLIF